MSSQPLKKTDTQQIKSKARLLVELFGQDGVERLKRAGLEADLPSAQSAATAHAGGTTGVEASAQASLLARFREKGLLSSKPKATQSPIRAKQQAPKARQESLTQRIVEHIDETKLGTEHPAVVAMILRNQTKTIRNQVLKALPSAHALAVVRHIRALNAGA